MPIFETKGLTKLFGGIRAVDHLDFSVEKGQIKSLIGPNGAGKTTVFNLISGMLKPNVGSIFYNGVCIDKMKSYQRCKVGIGRTFQLPHMFSKLNILENIMIGCHPWTKKEIVANIFRSKIAKKEEMEIEKVSREIINLLDLTEDIFKPALNLPYGKQKIVAIGRALASKPKLLLLDEPSTGLNEMETKWLANLLLKIRKMDMSLLLIEHDVGLVMEISDEIVVINYGEKIAEGSPDRIIKDEKVISAYLGN